MPDASEPIRVLYVARAPFISGAERALISTLRQLDRTKVLPGLVLGHDTAIRAQAMGLGIPVWIVPLAKRGLGTLVGWLRSVRRMRTVIREFRPHILHANDVPSCQAISILGGKMQLPRVVHVRWTITARDAAWWARGGAEVVLCISRYVRDELGDPGQTSLQKSQIQVINDAVDWAAAAASIGKIDRMGGTENTLASSASACTSPVRLGFAGQLIPAKGLDLLIEALALLPTGSRPKVLVAGADTQRGGAYLRELQTLAANKGVGDDIQWLGFMEDVKQLYANVDAVICPSREEPLGLVPLEAAEYHRPALASNVGGLAETVLDGETGRLIEPVPQAWTDVLQTLDKTTLCQWGDAAWQRTCDLYSPVAYQQQLMGIYERLVGRTAAADMADDGWILNENGGNAAKNNENIANDDAKREP